VDIKVRVAEVRLVGQVSLGEASTGSCSERSSRVKGRKSRVRSSRGRVGEGGEGGMGVVGFTREGGQATRRPGATIKAGVVADALAAGRARFV
jgi:hypothetical protein